MQISISEVRPACSPVLKASFEGRELCTPSSRHCAAAPWAWARNACGFQLLMLLRLQLINQITLLGSRDSLYLHNPPINNELYIVLSANWVLWCSTSTGTMHKKGKELIFCFSSSQHSLQRNRSGNLDDWGPPKFLTELQTPTDGE